MDPRETDRRVTAGYCTGIGVAQRQRLPTRSRWLAMVVGRRGA